VRWARGCSDRDRVHPLGKKPRFGQELSSFHTTPIIHNPVRRKRLPLDLRNFSGRIRHGLPPPIYQPRVNGGKSKTKNKKKQRRRTRKRFPDNRRLAQKPPLGLNLIHHLSTRLIDQDGVQRVVLREDEFQNHRRGSSRVSVQEQMGRRDAEDTRIDEWPVVVRWEPQGQTRVPYVLVVCCLPLRSGPVPT